MSRDSSGTYSRVVTPPVNGDIADADDFNAEINDLGAEMTVSLEASGKKTWTGNQNANGYGVKTLANTKVHTTAGGTTAYTVTTGAAFTTYAQLPIIFVKANATNTASMTVNVDGIGALTVKKNGATNLASGDFIQDYVYALAYDGTSLQLIGGAFGAINGALYQPLDATTTALAALSWSSGNALIQVTAADTVSLTLTPSVTSITATTVLPTTIELGHATDTTLARVAAGRVSVEGAELGRLSAAQDWSAHQSFIGITIDGGGTFEAGSLYADSGTGLAVRSKTSGPSSRVFGFYNDTGTLLWEWGNSNNFAIAGIETLTNTANVDTRLTDATHVSFSSNVHMVRTTRAANSAFQFVSCRSSAGGDIEFTLDGDGEAYADGAWTGGGADYAEYFEWSDGNLNNEDRRGIAVVLDGAMMREAKAGEEPFGVISGNPSVVGDASWNKWTGKHVRDVFGSYVLDENGDRQLSADYDPAAPYTPRAERPEWDCVGLMGKLRVRAGQATNARWIKMREITPEVHEWLVR